MPVSRYFPRPGVAPGRIPFPTVKVFLLLSPAVAQESAGIHFEFFPVHTISTERRRLSARCGGYPPAYAQLIHKLHNVINRVLISPSLNVIRRSFAATSGNHIDVSVKQCHEAFTRRRRSFPVDGTRPSSPGIRCRLHAAAGCRAHRPLPPCRTPVPPRRGVT